MKTFSQLSEQIHQVFPDSEPPDYPYISETDFEAFDCANAFRGLRWKDATASFLVHHSSCLSFLPNRTIAYYLPSFLNCIFAMLNKSQNDDDTWELLYCVNFLTWERNALLILEWLNSNQRYAVGEALQRLNSWFLEDGEWEPSYRFGESANFWLGLSASREDTQDANGTGSHEK